MERKMGVEPTTYTLARYRTTTVLLPHGLLYYIKVHATLQVLLLTKKI